MADSSELQLPVLPLPDAVMLPGMVIPVTLDGEARAAVDASRASEESRVLVVPRMNGVFSTVGVVAEIDEVGQLPSGEPAALLRALQRVKIGSAVAGAGAALWVRAIPVTDTESTPETKELVSTFRSLLVSVLQTRNAWQIIDAVQRINDPGQLADTAGYSSYLNVEQKLSLLETADVDLRLTRLIEWTRAHLEELDVAERIRDDVREGMEKSQREFLLRQQLAAIRKELGENEPEGSEDYRSRVELANLPEEVRVAALREVDKLERTNEQSPEVGWIRTWLDTVLELPWSERTTDTTDITAARAVLDADHYGLDDVKDRIIEHLAVRLRRAERGLEIVGGRGSGAVLALVGPPGVGKTSLGESVARALGRRFVRVALGGIRDEAEIRGHRRTYVGALPGRIVRAIQEAGSMNPVVLLDEVDKLGADFRGDPASALLEVLDPAQNHTFRDHYLELELDLSDVLFLATANVADSIPSALLDRMELVRLDGYTEQEKVGIARDHLVPRALSRAALGSDEASISDEALRLIAAEYTREAGVRDLERSIGKILRKVATKLATDSTTPVVVESSNLREFLGRPRFTPETADRTSVPGVATGLAVTGAGGEVLFIEASSVPGEPRLTLTGQLGDVMKESAQIALSYLMAHASDLSVPLEPLRTGVHLHVPAGAVPKDGPSAGVTMVTALASLATQRSVRADVAMTGEVTLNGRVLPIGGVKQKLLAAHRAGVRTVFIPARNEPDLDDVPQNVLDDLDVRLVSDASVLVREALEPLIATGASVPNAA